MVKFTDSEWLTNSEALSKTAIILLSQDNIGLKEKWLGDAHFIFLESISFELWPTPLALAVKLKICIGSAYSFWGAILEKKTKFAKLL